ncbi:MAG: hypothetical protein K6U74_14655, partial [Firmicutes bacterium]|nr:hypothetical protein [Bacillota bacterium]
SWYKKKYPNLSDEQLAMVMLGDAMGNTDNPDEGDAISMGDNEGSVGDLASSSEAYPDEVYEEEPQAEPEWEPEPAPGIEQPEPQPSPEAETEQEPETLVVQTSANGAQTLYVKDPKTGEWVDPETNSVLDVEKHGEALEQLKQEKKWNDAELEKISAGESEHDKSLRDSMEKIRDKESNENYKNALKSKYGTDNLEEIAVIVEERKQREAEWAEIWHRNDKILGVAEVGAVAVGTAADVGIDGLAVITPGGTKIRTIYKISKGVASTMAEAGAKGKDMVNWGNLAEGAIKGGADAGLDYIPGSGGIKTMAAKAGVTVLGEGAGSAAGAALRGEDAGKALSEGLKAGAYKATVSAITDKAAGDLPNPVMTSGSFKAVPNLKNAIVSGAGGTKIGAALADEYGVKPIISDGK